MNKKLFVTSVFAFIMASTSTFGQQTEEKSIRLDEVIISATKFKLKREKVGKVITKISQEEIKSNAGKTVLELLNSVPGVEIKGSNSVFGEVKGTYVRGGRNRQVLVLVDGVPLIDPTGISLEFDLRLLSLSQIESIEVMKGASSTLYGSGAATGVVNIILKKASKNAFSGTFETSYGTNNSATSSTKNLPDTNLNAAVRGTIHAFNYLASINVTEVDGLSAAKSISNQPFTTDPFYSENGFAKLGYQFSDQLNIDSFFNIDELAYSYDGGKNTDSDTNEVIQKQIRVGLKPTYNYTNGSIIASVTLNKVERVFLTESYEGSSFNIDAVHNYRIDNTTQFITGINYQEHKNQTNSPWGNINNDLANFNALDLYGSFVYTTDFNLTINAGGRLNRHSNYGSHFVYHINPSLNIDALEDVSLKLLSSYSSAFIAPSLYQLFSVYGNTDLEPETNKTFEIGFESSYQNWLQLNLVYFDRVESNTLIYRNLSISPWGQYENSNTTINAKGIETFMSIDPISEINFTIGYTYTDKNSDADYIPADKLTAQLNYEPTNAFFLSVAYKNVGARTGRFYDAVTFATLSQQLESYQIVDFTTNYKVLNNQVVFFGAITNVLNADYEETIGYNTRGRNYKFGIRLEL